MFESVDVTPRPNWLRRGACLVAATAVVAGATSLWRMRQMPLRSYQGQLPPLSSAQSEIAARLGEHARHLSSAIGIRNVDRSGSLKRTSDYIRKVLEDSGYKVDEQTHLAEGQNVSNLEAELPGSASTEPILVVGAHYDSVNETVGADDNASGVAAVLEIARLLKNRKFRRNIRFVLFANEEPPFFQTEFMGSVVYAKKLRQEGLRVSAMISVETIGFYSDAQGSQKYPTPLNWFYPSRGNFIGFVANSQSRDLVRRAIRSFRESELFPSEGIAAPAAWPGIGWSDHWSFWQEGYPAIMITDTAIFRYPHYHTAQDTQEKLDFEKMARVVEGTSFVVSTLAEIQ